MADTIAAMEECTVACLHCARRCRHEDPDRTATCIATCRACADVCDATVQVLRDAPVSRLEIAVAQLRAAYEATRTCAVECAEYPMEYCRQCAATCATARDLVKRLLATLERGLMPAAVPQVRDLPRHDD